MATVEREQFSSQADPALLERMREIAAADGRPFQSVLEDALRVYVECRTKKNVRPEVMAHFWASVERNRRLLELLAQ